MKKWLFWVAFVCYISAAQAGPLGLDMGTPFEVLNKQLRLKPEKPYQYSAASLPNGHPDFEDYRLTVTPKHGLCKIVAWSKTIRTSVYGDELKSKFEQLEGALTAKYGPGKKYDFLRSGSIWNKSRDWMMGLRTNERRLVSYWSTKERELPNDIGAIKLQVHAVSTEAGMIQLGYEFKNSSDCIDWINAQKDSPL